MEKFRIGSLEQGNNGSIKEFYMKVKRYGKLVEYNEEQLRYFFLRGLSPENQLEVRRCGAELSLVEENSPIEAFIDPGTSINVVKKKYIGLTFHESNIESKIEGFNGLINALGKIDLLTMMESIKTPIP
ncbi:hypothetical protein Glove_568g4 [Diversispora epigaea]|uniref:Uncharacterized protein n=1 Tax=Diversispora epigaea TaxID=1348612 RepID=A0A397GFH1_9GLOM|nr:hypothetical protein Glove_568g4 [Diversispora epigaea]